MATYLIPGVGLVEGSGETFLIPGAGLVEFPSEATGGQPAAKRLGAVSGALGRIQMGNNVSIKVW